MRLWTLHPCYLDAKGLVAAWREALLAQKVISARTRGYTRHPQLTRFQRQVRPLGAIAAFLHGIADEADKRGYRFDRARILEQGHVGQMEETRGQLLYEWSHLREKLKHRAPEIEARFAHIRIPQPHPLFRIVRGEVQPWEKIH